MSFSLHMRLPSARSVTLMRARSPGAMTSALGVTLNAPMLIDGSGGDCGGCALAPRNRGSCACAGAGCCSGRVLCAPHAQSSVQFVSAQQKARKHTLEHYLLNAR
jgi:hypothetical protein